MLIDYIDCICKCNCTGMQIIYISYKNPDRSNKFVLKNLFLKLIVFSYLVMYRLY